jgi:hypothetical protein
VVLMTWLLVLTLTLPPGQTVRAPVGEMVSLEACMFAGEAMAKDLIGQGLALMVAIDCIPGEAA